jgi:hypothetical protein
LLKDLKKAKQVGSELEKTAKDEKISLSQKFEELKDRF